MKQDKQFKPQSLRSLLATLLAVVIIGGGAAFYFGLGMVRNYSDEVNQLLADADASSKQVQELQVLKSQLSQSNSLIEKANQLFAAPSTYQSRVLSDIERYAGISGLTVTKTDFATDPQNPGTATVTVTLQTPVNYAKFITFLTNIESNLPKLQVSSLSLGYAEGANAENVHVGDIKIDVSVR